MARYEHLPSYQQALDPAVQFERVVAGCSRYHKYTLGTELRHQSRTVVAQVMRANNALDKAPQLLKLREQLDELLLTARIVKEARAFPGFRACQHVIEQLVTVCRQNEGWPKSFFHSDRFGLIGRRRV